MLPAPDIVAFTDLLFPIDTEGQQRYVYAYVDEHGTCAIRDFREQLLTTGQKSAWNLYRVTMRRYGLEGKAPWEKWHMLDPSKPPEGILKDTRGNKLSLANMGEFKNVGHQSRIFHHLEPGGLVVLLTPYVGKKENALTAESVNPALKAREEYLRRKTALLLARSRKK